MDEDWAAVLARETRRDDMRRLFDILAAEERERITPGLCLFCGKPISETEASHQSLRGARTVRYHRACYQGTGQR